MAEPCELLTSFYEGSIDAEDAARFRRHLPDCPGCMRQLDREVQLSAAVGTVPRATTEGWLDQAGRRRSATRALARWGSPLCVAALVLLYWQRPPRLEPLGAVRTIEQRIAIAEVDSHRPVDPLHSADAPALDIPFEQMAAFQKRKDFRSMAALYLMARDWTRAEQSLRSVPRSPDVDNDLAAAVLGAGRKEEALGILDGVLAQRPDHRQAMWNRGLALRELGLPMSAAAVFDAVAALEKKGGWRQEAQRRASELGDTLRSRGLAWNRDVDELGKKMRSDDLPDPAAAAIHRGIGRHFLYDAVRAAPSRERVEALLPIARTLDGLSGGTVLADYVRTRAEADFNPRAPLAAEYREVLAQRGPSSSVEIDALLDRARRAAQPDILLGLLLKTDRAAAHLDEFRALADSSGDPWFRALSASELARAQSSRGELPAAERTLQDALRECVAAKIEFRCAALENELALLYTTWHRPVEADEHARSGLRMAAEIGEWGTEVVLLQTLGQIARFRHDFPVTRAYLDEARLRQPGNCAIEQAAHASLATMYSQELDLRAARAEIKQALPCDGRLSLLANCVLADLARYDGTVDEAQRVRADLAALRPTLAPGTRALADHCEGRLMLEHDAEAGVALLQRSIAAAEGLPAWDIDGVKARRHSQVLLAIDAARRGDGTAAMTLLARQGDMTQPPGACSLGVAVDDQRGMSVAVDAGGRAEVHYEPSRAGWRVDMARLVPPEIRARLVGCASVGILAAAPLHGRSDVLPAEFAWAYRSGGTQEPRAPLPPRRLVVTDVRPPPSLRLPALGPWTSATPADLTLSQEQATPANVLRAMGSATEIEWNVHGLVDASRSDASILVLSADAEGRYALTAADVSKSRLSGQPLVILGACRAAATAPYLHEAWSLPVAFVRAGARAVIAATADIPDIDAGLFFDALRRRFANGQPMAEALRDERVKWLARDPGSWVKSLILFQ